MTSRRCFQSPTIAPTVTPPLLQTASVGSTGTTSFDTGVPRRLCGVKSYAGIYVDGIQFIFCDGSQSAYYGNYPNLAVTWNTTYDDPITYVTGGSGSLIDGIQFFTATKSSPLFGGSTGFPFVMSTGGGIYRVAGAYSNFLNSIRFDYYNNSNAFPGCLSTSIGQVKANNVSMGSSDQQILCIAKPSVGASGIVALGFSWCNGTNTGWVGANLGAGVFFTTTSGDPITQVSGYASSTAINQIQFRTASGTPSTVYGSATGTPFSINLGAGLIGAEGTVGSDGSLGSVQFRFKCMAPTTSPTVTPTTQPTRVRTGGKVHEEEEEEAIKGVPWLRPALVISVLSCCFSSSHPPNAVVIVWTHPPTARDPVSDNHADDEPYTGNPP